MNLYEEFEAWFNSPEPYGLRSERFYNLVNTDPQTFKLIENWLRAAHAQGARTAYQDALEHIKPYEYAHQQLYVHATKALGSEA